MDEEYKNKLQIAESAYAQIMGLMESIEKESPYEIGFCWDECIWVDDILFHYNDMKENK